MPLGEVLRDLHAGDRERDDERQVEEEFEVGGGATVLVVVAMIAGLSVARMVTDPEWAFTRPEISDVRVARLRRALGFGRRSMRSRNGS